MGFKAEKLVRKLITGDRLTPHINMYQDRGKFPPTWNIEIRNDKPVDKYFHPSGDCYLPLRELYFHKHPDYKLDRAPVSYALRRVFDCGHMWHGYLQEMLIEMGFVKRENVERPLEHHHPSMKVGDAMWTGRGTADLVDVDIPGHGKWLVDIKTMSDAEFDDGPRPDTLKKWTAQVNCYLDWLGTESAFILAVRKGGSPGRAGKPAHDFREIKIAYDPVLINNIYDRWTQVANAIAANEPPPCEHDKSKICSLGDLCGFSPLTPESNV
jgi:hypothetical protein